MASSPQAKKRARQAEVNRIRNSSQRSRLRTFVKKVLVAIKSGDKEQAVAAFKVAESILDSSASKGVIHKNKAARGKSRLNAKVKALVLATA
ncbi:MAG: 30S ribosomal protein S20 [Methylococcales bacterium]